MKKTGPYTPEYRRQRPAPTPQPAERASKYITISVAEYHFLIKMATLLEVIMKDTTHSVSSAVDAVKAIIKELTEPTEEGAAE